MGGLYDILEAYRLQDPKFTYEGLYQDPPRDDSVYYSGGLKTNPYGLMLGAPKGTSSQAFKFSSFPQTYEKSLFNPRVGRPEQSIYYNQPFNINNVAPQDVNTGIMTQAPTQNFQFLSSAYEDDDEEQVKYIPGQESSGIEKLFSFLRSLPTPGNLLRGGLESLRGFNDRLRNTDFGRSQTLAEYFDRRARAKNAERMAERARDFSERTAGSGATGGDRDFSTPAGKSTGYEEASRGFAASR